MMKLSERYEGMAHWAREQDSGKQLQRRLPSGTWIEDKLNAAEPADPNHWRVKPEPPAVRYVNEYPDGTGSARPSLDDAVAWVNSNATRTAIPYVELTPEVKAALDAAGVDLGVEG